MRLFEILRYAHFHDSRTEFIGDIRFSLLGIMELKQA